MRKGTIVDMSRGDSAVPPARALDRLLIEGRLKSEPAPKNVEPIYQSGVELAVAGVGNT